MKNRKKIAVCIVFTAYCLMMIYLLFFNGRRNYFDCSFAEYAVRNTNFVPFRYINGYIRNLKDGEKISYATMNLVGNVAVFIPLGALLPVVFKKLVSFPKYILTAVFIPLAIESLQLIFMVGCFDVDDIILNVIGLLMGYGLYMLIKRE